MNSNWKTIGGFGAHIKSTRDEIIVHQKGSVSEIPIQDLSHLLIMGGHNLQTSAITALIRQGVFISFCESDGEPVGYIAPYNYSEHDEIQKLQSSALPYSYALACATASIESRILAIESYTEQSEEQILFSGELEILSGYSNEIINLVRIEEIRRIEHLVRDMYYEFLSRLIDPSLQFKRRSKRPYTDPVNAILSFGYGMLSSACLRSLVGAHLNPSHGFLNRGKNALVNDLINCFKYEMIDKPALQFIKKETVREDRYEIGKERCVLSDSLIKELIGLFQETIDPIIIENQVQNLLAALQNEKPFRILKTPIN